MISKKGFKIIFTLPNGVFGEYVFSLDASDSELSSSDEVSVTVNEPSEFSTIYVSSSSNGTVGGVSFRDEDILAFDIFSFSPNSLGSNTSGSFISFWESLENGFGGENLDGLSLV